MRGESDPNGADFKYWAFLSYSHTDKKWGDWLHKALEGYRVPRRLVGRDARDGKIPARVFPIFRDREELPVSADLSSNINKALRESRYLVVICSPRSAQSRWVGEEIKTYKGLGREDRILAFIIDGEPNASDGKVGFKPEEECFHEAMRYRIVDGALSDLRTEPIAADAREGRDGRRNAKLKLLAGLLGINYDDLKQREQERRLRRARALGAAAFLLLGVFGALTVALFFKEREATRARVRAVDAERQTQLQASKADGDIAIRLAGQGDEATAFAHAVRALDRNPKNTIAAILAYRLLGDGPLTLATRLLKHSSAVRAMAFSRDGRRVATGCDDGSVMVADLETGQKFVLPERLLASVVKIAFSPGGESVAIATGDEAGQQPLVRTWQFQTAEKPAVVGKDFVWGVLELAWPLPDRIVAHSGRDWGSADRRTQVFGLTQRGWEVLFGVGDLSESKQTLPSTLESTAMETWVSEQGGLLVVHDKKTNRLSWFELQSPNNFTKPIHSVSTLENDIVDVAVQNGIAVIGTTFTKKLIWRRSYGEDNDPKRRSILKWVDPHSRQQGVIQLAHEMLFDRISANGERILAVKGDTAVILNRRNGQEVGSMPMKKAEENDLLAFSLDGTSLLLRSEANRAVLGEFGENKDLHESGVSIPARIATADLDLSGKWLAISSNDKNVRVWSRSALAQPPLAVSGGPPKPETAAQETADASQSDDDSAYRLNMSGDTINDTRMEVVRVDLTTKEETHVCSLHKVEDVEGITGHSFSPDGTRLVITHGSWSSRPDNNAPSVAVLYDTTSGHIIGDPLKHDDDVFSPCFAPNGKWFVTISDDRTVRRWDGQTGAAIGEPLRLPVWRRFVQVSPNSDLLVTGGGHIIDVTKWQVVKELTPEPVALSRVLFSPDGLWMATMSSTRFRDKARTQSGVDVNQWELKNALRISQPLDVALEMKDWKAWGPSFRWRDPGESVTIGNDLVWRCNLPAIETVLPFFHGCRPLIISDEAEQIINDRCSLDALTLKEFFPQGRTDQNQSGYDFAARVLERARGARRHSAPK